MASLRTELETIYEQRRQLTAPLVVAYGRENPSSAIARHVFHVGEGEAAERYYHDRARNLIRRFKVKRDPNVDPTMSTRVRAYHSIPTDQGQAYRSTEDIVEDDFQRALLLSQMRREWKALKDKYEHFEEFAAMIRGDITEEAA